mmetsp:Transcript_116758/g.232709  ORF Transcript_116758/g.232709 Transcript_116758/m.232709 type:complete len:113 (+) Transcript_116758:134-472(+)
MQGVAAVRKAGATTQRPPKQQWAGDAARTCLLSRLGRSHKAAAAAWLAQDWLRRYASVQDSSAVYQEEPTAAEIAAALLPACLHKSTMPAAGLFSSDVPEARYGPLDEDEFQ